MVSKRRPSAHAIAGNDDLLTEILLRLPIRPLLRFKSVSKHWLSLITSTRFCRQRSRGIDAPSGLFMPRYSICANTQYDFVPLEDTGPTKPPFRTLTFVDDDDPNGIRILRSCNGLLCCYTFGRLATKWNYHIYNPTTHQFITLPDPAGRVFRYSCGIESVHAVNLAFDPSKSPHYKAVCVYSSERLPQHYEIGVYSSETGLWRRSGDPFLAEINFKLGVFWNGAINWVSLCGDSLYFNVDEEHLGTMPMPGGWVGRRLIYLGECNDHLHLIEIYDLRSTHFSVYEMAKDYSGWSVKYLVDLDPVMDAFAESIISYFYPSDLYYYNFCILSVIRRDDDDDSFLVLNIPGKVIRYNFKDRTFKKLCDFDEDCRMVQWYDAFQYIESLSCV